MKKIVMIEDNEDHALLIRRGLEEPECSVTHYSDGAEALQFLGQMANPAQRPDLILLDLKLPGMDGFEVLEALKKMEWCLAVPVVILTTSARKEEIAKAYRLGAGGYVVKSDEFSEFVAKLKCVKDYWFHTVELPGRIA